MPRISDEMRERVNAKLETSQRIKDSFKGRQYVSQHCHLCNWASNGRNLEEAVSANREHERSHPEYAEWEESSIPAKELVDSLHDHDCQLERCNCICGCQDGPFCVLVFGGLCSVCQVRNIRGDDKHGSPQEEPES